MVDGRGESTRPAQQEISVLCMDIGAWSSAELALNCILKSGAFCFGRLGDIRGKAHLSTVPGVLFLRLFPIARQTSTLLIDSMGNVCPYWKSVANKGEGYS